MDDRIRQNLISGDIWGRGLYMLLFVGAYSIAELIVIVLSLYQFVSVLFTGRANEPLLQFGKNLSVYIYEILEFQTFNTEQRPFPFSPWPDDEPGGEEWIDDSDIDSDLDDDLEGELMDSEDESDRETNDEEQPDGDGDKPVNIRSV
jgi:hypothetical protein